MKSLSFFTPERRWVLIFAFVVMVITTVPYIVGFAIQGDEWRFTGFVFGVEDGNSYIAKMLSGSSGNWLFRTPYTSFRQRGFLIFLPYILLGKLVSSPDLHEKLVTLYHIFRFLAGLLSIIATYEFISFFIVDIKYRRMGLVLATLGGGLGWILILPILQGWFVSLPLEFYSPESFGFLSLFIIPHIALARAFLLYGLVWYLKSIKNIDTLQSITSEGLKIGLVWLLTGLAQPLTGMVIGAIVMIYLAALIIWQAWSNIKQCQTQWTMFRNIVKLTFWSCLLPTPLVLYNLITTEIDPFVKLWMEQSYLGSPHPIYYVLAYGLIIPFVIIGGYNLWNSDDWANKLPVVWVLFLPCLVYAPVSVQRRLAEGVWVAMVVLAMKSFDMKKYYHLRKYYPILILAFPSTIILLFEGLLLAASHGEPVFRSTSEVESYKFLEGQQDSEFIVLSSYETGNAMPSWVPIFVVIGHGPESVGLNHLMPQVEAFYQNNTSDFIRLEFLMEQEIDLVFWGPEERKLGGWDPNQASYLRKLYDQRGYSIFEFIPNT